MSDLEREVDILSEEDIEAVEEAAMPTNPKEEEASVNSVDKASKVGKSQKARKGDKLSAKDEPADSKDKNFKNKMWEDADFSDDLNALVEGESSLDEGFKEKAATIFEAALTTKLEEEVARIESEYEDQLSEAVESVKSELEEKVNNYLGYVVESWMEENELAIENNIRTEVAEGFMENLKQLFVESYIEVPESKVDLVDELADHAVELEEQLNAAMEDNMEITSQYEALQESVLEMQKEMALIEACEDLSITQAEKLEKLAEGLEAADLETFERKVATLKESYFTEKAAEYVAEESEVEATDSETIVEDVDMSDWMASISSAIARGSKK